MFLNPDIHGTIVVAIVGVQAHFLWGGGCPEYARMT